MPTTPPLKRGFSLLSVGIALLTFFSIFHASSVFTGQSTIQQTHTVAGSGSMQKPALHTPKNTLADTWNGFHPFQVFDTSMNAKVIARTYDAIWGASVAKIPIYRSINPSMFLSYYLPFNRDHGNFRDGSGLHSLTYWQAFHPNWVLYQCDGVTPAYVSGDPNVPLDFTNPQVIAWQVQNYALPASQRGYDAIAADNVDFGDWSKACGVYKNGQWVQLFSGQFDDSAWRTALLNWLSQMGTALHSLAHPLALIPNLGIGDLSPLDPIILQAADLSDGILDEGGFTNYGSGYDTGTAWVQRVQLNEYLQSEYKPYFIIDNFPKVNRFNIQWALASYLMGKEHSSEISINRTFQYGINAWLAEYNAQIGSPSSSMYQSQHVYWRDYSNGESIVNPDAASSFTITLNSSVHYVDLYGNTMSGTVTLPAHSGLVLLIQVQASRHASR